MDTWVPTHRFDLHDGTSVLVRVELRGDWVAYEEDGRSWYTVVGPMYCWWSSSARGVSTVRRVVDLGYDLNEVRSARKGKTIRLYGTQVKITRRVKESDGVVRLEWEDIGEGLPVSSWRGGPCACALTWGIFDIQEKNI